MGTTTIATATMKTAQVPGPGAEFQIVEREIPVPGPGQVRIKVQACGVCHSDAFTKDGSWPGIQYPRIPGHEAVGIIDKTGAGVSEWKKDQRVGLGWHGGHDGTCRYCRRGDFRNCRNIQVPGISYDGGYQEYMLAPVTALVAIPESLSATEAAPLLDKPRRQTIWRAKKLVAIRRWYCSVPSGEHSTNTMVSSDTIVL